MPFKILRDKLALAIGMPSSQELPRFDTLAGISRDDSLIFSDTSSQSSGQSSLLHKMGIRQSSTASMDLCSYNPKKGVCKVLKMIKQLNMSQSKDLSLMAFLEMIQLRFYKNISLVLLREFMQCHKIMPKPFYFHYFIYFLHYAEYYHFTRLNINVIDQSKQEFHAECLDCIRAQLNYICDIINKSSQPSSQTSSQEISL